MYYTGIFNSHRQPAKTKMAASGWETIIANNETDIRSASLMLPATQC
ncbi:hypothetical protein SAMN04488122_4328 [Chitinophaga arvensicola]|uniref:Uncharacterized protein n=1 Tax=Chitinophaga arvensicola TaxID=29529 RepID=A0A1I0S970_9BACT|nr:hypothetical protein SAMN04488122_4328 [Chitinophaga arvensicola]